MNEVNKNKKELIIDCFERMDVDMLELKLDNSYTYQDVSKETFLNNNEVLENFYSLTYHLKKRGMI
jgi:hypothetical protein